MVTHASEESGLEELQRLSREIGDKGKELAYGLGRARKSIEQVEKKRALWSIIRELKISLVLDKLQPLAGFEIINEVKSLKNDHSTAGLRRIILNMVEELEKSISSDDRALIDIPAIKKKLMILSILIELIFVIE
jgi:hypothetical protein